MAEGPVFKGLFLGGRWTEPEGRKRFVTTNPTNGSPVGEFISGTVDDVGAAVAAARAAYPSWKETPPPKRGEILLEAATILKRRKEEIARTVTREMGKVIAEGRGDVQESIDFIEFMAGEGRRLYGETVPSELHAKFCLTVRQPKGVVACITPWNFPTSIPNWKIAAALICGNSVVFKPASNTSLSAARIVEVYEEAGVPLGVLNFVTGSGGVVGNALVSHPGVRAVSFTGGVETGREVYVRGAQGLKMVHLELGGKNPQIVLDDANLDLALDGVLFGAFGTAGAALHRHEPAHPPRAGLRRVHGPPARAGPRPQDRRPARGVDRYGTGRLARPGDEGARLRQDRARGGRPPAHRR